MTQEPCPKCGEYHSCTELILQQQAEIEALKTMRGNSVLVPSDKLAEMQAELIILRKALNEMA